MSAKLMTLCALGAVVFLAAPAQAGSVAFVIDSIVVKTDQAVLYEDGEIMVPTPVAAGIVEGALSQDDPVLSTSFLRANDVDMTFFVGRNRVLINGSEMFLAHEPLARGKYVLVPIGFICETVGAKLIRVSHNRVLVERNRFAPVQRTGDERLMVTVNGVPFAPETWRALPTFDKLDVSAAEVAAMLGAHLKWDPELGAAVIDVDGRSVILFQNKIHALVDGRPVALTRVPILSKQKLLVPLDDVCWMLGRSLDQTTMWSFAIGMAQ